MMRTCTSVLGWVGVLMVSAAGAGAQEDFEWSARMDRGQTLEVIGISHWDDLHFSSVSGDITLSLPPGLDTEVEFESLSGDLDADFGVRIS